MTASRRRGLAGLALCAALAGPSGCRTPAGAPLGSLLEVEPRFALRVPDVADHTAAELAAAALRSDRPGTESALRRMRAIESVLAAGDEEPTGLLPLSTDLANASLDDPRAYGRASRELLGSPALSPALEARLGEAAGDDPLQLANRRIWDHRVQEFGRLFNRLAEPVGRSILTTVLLPYQLGRGALAYVVELYLKEPLSLWQRQALSHQKEFLRRYPDAPEAAEVEPEVQRGEERWTRTQAERAVGSAREALDGGSPRLTLVYAHRALRLVPEDRDASELRDEAARQVLALREELSRSLEAASEPAALASPAARPLALALLEPAGDVGGRAQELLASEPGGALADEAHFALALADAEAGRESAAWQRLAALGEASGRDANMARHARALLADPGENSLGAFEATRRAYALQRALWVVLGRWSGAPPERGLPRPLEWALALPAIAQSLVGSPLRLLQLPWQPPSPAAKQVAVHGNAYLERHPDGEHAAEVRDWLSALERGRENWVGALALEEQRPQVDPEALAELRPKAAQQMLRVAGDETNPSLRNALYRRLASEYRDTPAGQQAARLAREEAESLTPEHIRLTRGFLLENPQLAGPQGLGLRPGLLDGELDNGELHPQGVVLLGGRAVELDLVALSGDEDAAPDTRREELSEARLARLVSLLEETSQRNALVDPDNDVAPDAQRDSFFEAARLGLAGTPDPRGAARSDYVYRGMRERYGLVRSRESILPFDIVVKGSLTDLSLGAFPRIREPRRTPDAFLYE